MNKSRKSKKLTLNKETVKCLENDLDKVGAGVATEYIGRCQDRTDPSICSVCTAYC